MALADKANSYIQEKAPWQLSKEEGKETEVLAVCTQAINLFRVISTYLQPVLPQTAAKVAQFLNLPNLNWNAIAAPMLNLSINKFMPLMKRIEPTQIAAVIEASKEDVAKELGGSKQATKAKNVEQISDNNHGQSKMIEFNDFAKIDLRVAKVVQAQHVEGADKLLQLTLDVGESANKNVFSGIKSHYQPEDLIGKSVVFVYNLAPRKMKFGISEGMVLACGEGNDLWILESHQDAPAGTKIS